ncbi:MAG: cell wall-binding repeat-containing protein [Pseudolysinimonas sp.]
MSRNTPSFLRTLSVVAASALALAGIVAVAPAAIAVPASTATIAYTSIPATLPLTYPSLGFAATTTSEFGDEVQLAPGTARAVTSVSVGLDDWACQSDFTKAGGTWTAGTGGPCVTTPGASFTHPITLTLYDVNDSTSPPTLGKLITSVTQTVTIPFRPSADASCADPTSWKDATSGSCQHGLAFTAVFAIPAHPVVADHLVVAVSYNTSNAGAAPLHVAGPYDSLNVSVDATPTVGTDVDPDQMFLNSSVDTGWASDPGLSLSITTDDSVIPVASKQVTVRQQDVDPVEDANTYSRWHEGKNNATPAYSVHPDGIHLGDGTASTIVKGTDVVNSEVTESQLRQLLATASVTVAGGSVTMQVPINFGDSVSDHFTTLRSLSLTSGTHAFSLADTWATTRAFGPYTAQQEVTLGDLLNTIFSNYAHVWLAGYGVQADTSAIVSNIVWGDSSFTFNQPETAGCPATTTASTATNLSSAGWTFGDSRANGVNQFTATGLHVFTTPGSGSPDPRKAAGYHAADFGLGAAGVPALGLGASTGAKPSIQLRTDFDGDGTVDGTLVGETIYGNDYWVSSAAGFVKDGAPSHSGGFGSTNHGTLNQWLVSFPNARVLSVGYSLGSGVDGDSVIQSITAGCVVYGFTSATVPASTSTVSVPDTAIRPNENTYPGWHEGASNASRSFSVQSDGLHLGFPSHSQIIDGLNAPLATSNIESVITAMSTTVGSGSVTLQVPVFYGAANHFTTLRSASLTAGTHGVSVSDLWTTTRAILAANGSTILVAGSTLPLADLSALLSSLGNVQVLAFGVQADTAAVVSEITAMGIDYEFVPTPFPPVSSTVTVRDSGIAPAESAATYQQWHEGYANPAPSYTTQNDELELGTLTHSQIIKGVGTPADATTTATLIETAKVVVNAGSVTYQVPAFYGSGTSFTTLHSDSLTAGTHTFTLSSLWASSKTIGSIVAGQLYPLGDILDALGNVRALAFGVQADDDAKVAAISWSGVKYVFASDVSITRITGDTRYDVAVAISQRYAPGLDSVYLAAGGNYPDALSAAPVAAKNGAPLLLTPTDALPASVVTELNRLHPHNVIVVGGPASVSPAVLAQVSALSFLPTVTRITGNDRYEVSRLVTRSAFTTVHTIYLASGANFPDALAAAPAAAKNVSPVILVPGTNPTVDAPTLALLHSLGVTDIIIAGGPATVSDGIKNQLALLYTVHRKSGDTRYDTPVQVNQGLFTSAHEVFIATGQNFPDALSGAALAGSTASPLFLATPTCIPQAALAAINALDPDKITLLGGPGSLTPAVAALTPCSF